MPIVALDPGYAEKIDVRDREENFHGNIVVYIHWEDHLSFCAAMAFPLPPDMPFGALLQEIIPTYYGMHPDFPRIDWPAVRWTIDGREVTPDPAASLRDHGVHHKSLIRFRTPGLTGFRGSGS
ncbi:phenol hydroxylase subunit P4 [Azospirillum halopraeferens]|uniref:phenol hydroxylase subunit P4 n=1 Tax=Azospirillum halopraeferens TaxID=34010 RepID=UPI0004200B70|nr:phenol hydroxylase subunit P4 [Azospirillum halopraeferens]